METELKSCPFCGGTATLIATSTCTGYVSCVGECGMSTRKFWDVPMCEPVENRRKWHEIAAEAWNRRANEI